METAKRKYEKKYFGCTDPYGNNVPKEIFVNHILPILIKNKVNDKDIENIADNIIEMCERSYTNGMSSEAFDREDQDW